MVTVALCGLTTSLAAGPNSRAARPARLQSNLHLSTPVRDLVLQDSTLACFEGFLSSVVSPGCFFIDESHPGDPCETQSDQEFFIQYMYPTYTEPHLITGFGFLSNDGDTVFPSAGILVLPIEFDPVEGETVRWPTAEELANLQVTDIPTPDDTSVVFVDVRNANLVVGPGDNVAICAALQFPQGVLEDVTIGPGIVADSDEPDQDCDFFTIDGGTTDFWLSPYHDPNDPNSIPLDWGFVVTVEPYVAVQERDWTHVKQLYRSP